MVLPIRGAPIADGAVAVEGGRIVAVGSAPVVAGEWAALPERDLGDAILMPGFVDAHCHLEWSLTGGLVPGGDFADWLGALLRLSPDPGSADHTAAADLGALRCLESGTTTVADSGPTGAAAAALTRAGLRGVVHLEAFGRPTAARARDAASIHAERVLALDDRAGPLVGIGVAPHAPYTVGPDLWRALDAHPDLAVRRWTTHLAESPAETRLLRHGDGPLADLFAARGSEPGRWDGGGGPVERLHRAGALRPGLLAAHCVQIEGRDADLLAGAGVAIAHCPLSNRRLGCGRAPIEAMRAAGLAIGLGSDSPASAGAYDLRAEARECGDLHRRHAPLDAADLVALTTIGGARALGLDATIGTLEVGKRADLVGLVPASADPDPYAAVLDRSARVSFAMVDGVVVLDGGSPTRVDRDAVLAAAADARVGLAG